MSGVTALARGNEEYTMIRGSKTDPMFTIEYIFFMKSHGLLNIIDALKLHELSNY